MNKSVLLNDKGLPSPPVVLVESPVPLRLAATLPTLVDGEKHHRKVARTRLGHILEDAVDDPHARQTKTGSSGLGGGIR